MCKDGPGTVQGPPGLQISGCEPTGVIPEKCVSYIAVARASELTCNLGDIDSCPK